MPPLLHVVWAVCPKAVCGALMSVRYIAMLAMMFVDIMCFMDGILVVLALTEVLMFFCIFNT